MITAFRDGEELTEEEQRRAATAARYQRELSGYSVLQSQRPQTLAYGLHDSPAGQLAWITEKFFEWTDSASAPEDAVDRDQLLTNVMLYWLTGTAGSSARLYKESAGVWRTPARPSATPTGVAVFPKDLVLPVRRLAEKTDNIVHWTEYDRGGHFPAMEQPELLVADIRKFLL
jgi:microsomal epoxide hydrolase